MTTLLDLIRAAHPEWRTPEDILASVVAGLTDKEFEVMCLRYKNEPEMIEHLKKLREGRLKA